MIFDKGIACVFQRTCSKLSVDFDVVLQTLDIADAVQSDPYADNSTVGGSEVAKLDVYDWFEKTDDPGKWEYRKATREDESCLLYTSRCV